MFNSNTLKSYHNHYELTWTTKKGLGYLSITRQTVKITATFHITVLCAVADTQCKTRELHCVRILED